MKVVVERANYHLRSSVEWSIHWTEFRHTHISSATWCDQIYPMSPKIGQETWEL